MKIVAVTACPAGLAHTYMTATALNKAGKKYGVDIKVETQGAAGIQNEIKLSEVREADLVILAADAKVVKVERFKDKPIIKVSVGEALKNAESIIKSVLDNRN
jgi:fructose-specific phosphotransferase system IIB component